MSFMITRDELNKLLLEYFDETSTDKNVYTIDDVEFFIDSRQFNNGIQKANEYNSVDRREFESYLKGYLGERVRIGKNILEMNDTRVLRAFLGVNEGNCSANPLSLVSDLISQSDLIDGMKSEVLKICDTVSTNVDFNKLDTKDRDILKKFLEKELQDIIHKVVEDAF